MILNADFHIHSCFSMASSPNTTPQSLIKSCSVKGLNVLGSGDALHPQWRRMWEDFSGNSEGVSVVPSAEVEGKGRVHHLILMDDFSTAEQLYEKFSKYSPNIDKNGRPNILMQGCDIARIVHDCGAYIGPAHAFTPWTGMYGRFNSINDCYGEEIPDFLELGLSADTSYGNRISELDNLPFLSNSDAHSPLLHKIGREFNRINSPSAKPYDVIRSVLDGDIILNAGFFPEEGKYSRTACSRCYKHYSFSEAEALGWKCPLDGGRIKVGVYDKAMHLSDKKEAGKRPPYLHIMPLGEIIKKVLGFSSPCTKKCSEMYYELVSAFGDEISILTDIPVDRISEINESLGFAIQKFREEKVILHPGGGGMYGTFDL